MSYPCDICDISFDEKFLNLVTLERALFFVCTTCCECILLVPGWKSFSREELKRVLSLPQNTPCST